MRGKGLPGERNRSPLASLGPCLSLNALKMDADKMDTVGRCSVRWKEGMEVNKCELANRLPLRVTRVHPIGGHEQHPPIKIEKSLDDLQGCSALLCASTMSFPSLVAVSCATLEITKQTLDNHLEGMLQRQICDWNAFSHACCPRLSSLETDPTMRI